MKTIALAFGVTWLVGGAFCCTAWVIWDIWRSEPTEGAIAAGVTLVTLVAVAAIVYGVSP